MYKNHEIVRLKDGWIVIGTNIKGISYEDAEHKLNKLISKQQARNKKQNFKEIQ